MNVTYEHKPAMTFIGYSTSIRPEEGGNVIKRCRFNSSIVSARCNGMQRGNDTKGGVNCGWNPPPQKKHP